MTDKEILVEMLKRRGFEVDYEMWNAEEDETTIGVDTKDGSVGFAFNEAGDLKALFGRDW